MTRAVPHPWLSVLLLIIWCLLQNSASLGNLLLGGALALFIPFATQAYWPGSPGAGRVLQFGTYTLIVIWDILVANFIVARKVLFVKNADLSPAWVSVPLEIEAPEAITILAATITLTPGTITSDMSSNNRALLVHCLDAPDPDAVRDEIKNRYERRLKEIFS